jgi:hypothetical protein
MAPKAMDLIRAASIIERFTDSNLTARIARIESSIRNFDGAACRAHCGEVGINSDLLSAAYEFKRKAGQVNVLIHAVAVMLLVPKIIEPGERILAVSLGAGNSGRAFDVETNRRVAEFKFIHWQGHDTIRQNSLFKDFYDLAEYNTRKRKQLYVLEKERPLKFLRGRRAIKSVLSGKVKLYRDFQNRYPDRFKTVGEYFDFRRTAVEIVDASPFLPELMGKVVTWSVPTRH